MKILVCGGCGFIGSNFIRYILKKYPHYSIVNIDKLTYAGNIKNLEDISSLDNYNFRKGDICDRDLMRELIKDSEIIINFAAQTHVDRSIKTPEEFLKTNIWGVYNILEILRNDFGRRFVQISTDEVYGSILKGSFEEDSPLSPGSPYASSKASADLLCLSYFNTYKIPVVIIRSSNNFGPYQYPEKIISLSITNVLEGKRIPLYGDGLYIRDWLYVEDNVRAIDLIIHKGENGQIYNISSNNELTNIELAKKILSFMNKPLDFIEYVEDRPGHDRRYSINSERVRRLGWRPDFSFERALKSTILWYQENRDWWEPLKKS